MARIGISNRFFAKAKSDYSDWRQALIREALQNCIDSGAKNISFHISEYGDNTVLTFENDGSPMNREILETKLLSLGETGKGFQGDSVGGFGRAKELLYFTHLEYKIASGDLQVVGSGGEYDVSIADPTEVLEGTWSQVVIEGDETRGLAEQVRSLAACLQWRGTLKLNGEVLESRLNRGRTRVTYDWARVSTTEALSNMVVVRIGGIPMFSFSTSYHAGVIVELTGTSDQILTSNRDGLKWQYRDELNQFLNRLAVDRKTALRKTPDTLWHYYGGDRLGYFDTSANLAVQEATTAALASLGNSEGSGGLLDIFDTEQDSQERFVRVGYSRVSCEFHIKSELTRKVPKAYQGHWLSANAQWMIRVWARCLVEIHNLFKTQGSFGVGFYFESEDHQDSDSSVMALYQQHPKYGHVYLLNPVKWIRSKNGKSCMSPRWSKKDRYSLLATACHEYVHYLGHRYHDEDYTSTLTEVMGVVFAQNKKFSKFFK